MGISTDGACLGSKEGVAQSTPALYLQSCAIQEYLQKEFFNAIE